MSMFAIIQRNDYWFFRDGINPFHIYNEEELPDAIRWFNHAQYEVRPVEPTSDKEKV